MKTRLALWLSALILLMMQTVFPNGIPLRAASAPTPPQAGLTLAQLPPGLASAFASQTDQAPEYRAGVVAAGFHMENPANHLAADFDSKGVTLGGAAPLALRLQSWGAPGALQAAAPVRPERAGDARVQYRRPGGLVEWYQNSPLGLEQGFTLAQPPVAGAAEAVLDLSLDTALNPKLGSQGDLQLTNASAQPMLGYAGLQAWDANGRSLPARLELDGKELRLHVALAGAVYPLTVDPWLQQAGLTASDGALGDNFGISVAISGNTALVGAYNKTVGGHLAEGAAYIFTRSGSQWSQQQELAASDGTGDNFGASVALSGNTALIGAPFKTVGGHSSQGAAYVFTHSGGHWSQQQELTIPKGAANDGFGSSVALSGNSALIGAAGNKGVGEAFVFTFSSHSIFIPMVRK